MFKKFKLRFLTSLLFIFICLNIVLAADMPALPYVHDAVVPKQGELKDDNSFLISLSTGTASYSYGIDIPSGTNGLQPEISFSYNSQKTKGRPTILGIGWSLSQSYIQRDANHTFDDINDDTFDLVLNGNMNDLVYVLSENRYHTETENFLYIENKTNGNNTNEGYWIIKSKDGTSYRFGFNNDSETLSNQYNYTWRWNLDLINDTHDNKIYYSYLENPFTNDYGAVYPYKIEYNNDRKRIIEFIFESSDRPDIWEAYEDGNKIRETRRLKEIRVSANNEIVRKYIINYNVQGSQALSLISNITKYGDDNVTNLPPEKFRYESANKSWIHDDSWQPPGCFATQAGGDEGYRLADVNNDGLVDVLYSYRTSGSSCTSAERTAYINNGTNWYQDDNWQPPGCFMSGNGDEGYRLVDVNGDGWIDVLYGDRPAGGYCTDGKHAWINNKTTWVQNDNWKPPVCFSTSNGTDEGYRLADVNGDGLTDILYGARPVGGVCAGRQAWINNGTTWVQDDSWAPPDCFVVSDGTDEGYRIFDVNGDGMEDILYGAFPTGGSCTSAERTAYLSNGTGWIQDDSWEPPDCFVESGVGDTGCRFADVNGDGLTDVLYGLRPSGGSCTSAERTAYINNGTGWTQDDSWEPPDCFMWNGVDQSYRLVDVNGDGSVDILYGWVDNGVCTSAERTAYISNGGKSLLLRNITTGLSGTVSIDYKKSVYLNNKGDDGYSDLNFNLWLVSNITKDNNMSGNHHVSSVTLYNYSGGLYDYDNKEFRGFSYVKEEKDDSVTEHRFYQDDILKGREYLTEISDNLDNSYSRSDLLWRNITQNGYKILRLLAETKYTYDGDSFDPKITNVSYGYDDYGNLVSVNNFGDVDLEGDERYENYQYLANTGNWIVDKAKSYTLFYYDNVTKLKESNFTYDGLSYGSVPTKGELSSKEDWLDTGSNPVTLYNYDSYGNLLNETNSLGYVTQNRYGLNDTTYTFADRVIDSKGFITDFRYDLGTGGLLSETDSNGIIKTNTYDVFGRISKEILPYDSVNYPTKEYTYYFDGVAPEKVKISQKEQNGSSFDSYYFYDGFGKLVQSKTESENEFIVKDIYYDNFTRILKESDPYFSSYSFNYTSPNSSIPLIKYTYDAVGRTTKVINPDNTEKNIVYDHWNVANYDENNNRKDFVLDAYGKIINITENTGEEDYHTSYYYDGSGNLISIVDSKGNLFSFDYDSLGRKILSYNPDTGYTNYTYDSLGNLIKQVSGSGNLLNDSNYEREYNNFGQMIRISYLNNSVIEEYTYDPNGMRIKTYNYKSNTTTYTPFKEFMQIRNSSGVFNYTYVYEGDTLVVKINPDGSKSYYHPDHLGSTTLITNQSGSIVEEISYYPHGKPVEDSAEIKLYESKEYNDELEQYYYGARYYDPNLMIFIQPDSLIPDIYDPQQLNIYSFERNNPYKYVDKDGNAIQLAAVAYFAWKVWNACLTLAPLVYDIQQGNQITTEQTFYAFADTAIGFIPVFGDLVIDVPQTISALNEGLNNYVMNDETSVGFSQYLVEEAPNAIVESLNKDPKQKNIKEFLFLYEGDKSDRLLSFLYNYGSLTKEGDSGSQYVCYKGMCFYLSQNNYKKYTELIKNKNLYYEDDAENDESEMEEEDEKK